MENKTKLYQKMFKVMEAIEYIRKTTDISFGRNSYKALSEETVTPIFREEFIKNKLMVFPIEQISDKPNGVTRIDVKYKIVDTESGEYEILASSGEGADSQDKGAGKAMTYAYKYMLVRTFMIPTGDDPDRVSSAELDQIEKDKKTKKKNPKPKPKTWTVGNIEYTAKDVGELMLKHHQGDRKKATSDWNLLRI